MRDFKTLTIWQNSIVMVKQVYKFAEQLPADERFGLKSQICRAAVSIPSNIAEGCSRESQIDFKRFLQIALGSCFELETQLILIENLGLNKSNTDSIIIDLNKIQKQINSLIQKLKAGN